MKRLLLRADDLGFGEAVNYGIIKTVREGLIKNCGVMVNMAATAHAASLIRDVPCCLGLHCNVSVGRPLMAPAEVPTLVDERGLFYSSRQYRAANVEFASVADFCKELTAQYRRFVALFGRKPAYFEAHAVESKNLAIALEQVAGQNGLFYQPSFSDFTLGGTYVVNLPNHAMEPAYDARSALKQELSNVREDTCCLYVCHPGYLDRYLMDNSSLTLPRADEADMLCDPDIMAWLSEQGFTLVTYDSLARGEVDDLK